MTQDHENLIMVVSATDLEITYSSVIKSKLRRASMAVLSTCKKHCSFMYSAMLLFGLVALLLPASVRGELVVFQAENGLLRDVIIKTTHTGYEGSGFADYSDRGGGSIEWTYNTASRGDVDVTIRYATRNARPLDLFVDGIKRVRFDCPNTGSWSSWRTLTALVTVDQGSHSLRLEAPFSGPNVDWLSVLSTQSKQIDTATPTEAPQNENRPSTVVYEAETALSDNVVFQTTHTGFDGSSYADYGGLGAYLLWSIDAPATATYEIKVKYASANERNCKLYIDGVPKGTFSFGGTGAWGSWDFETMIVSLTQGEHFLKIVAESSPGPNIDWVSVSTTSCSGGSCTAAPVPTPAPVPKTPQPTGSPGTGSTANFPSRVVVASNRRLDRGDFVFSPNGQFKVGLTNQGDFVLQRSNGDTIWSAGTANQGNRLFVQSDGNMIIRRSDNQAIWTSETYDHAGAQLVVDDGGRIAVAEGNLAIWLEGIPRGEYKGRPSMNLQFPVRGMFYYPWYPETWSVNGARARFVPDLGLYSNSDPSIFQAQIDAFEYAWVDLLISSWWGPETNQDRGRISMMMEEIIAANSNVKLSFYYEDEMKERPSPQTIRSDLDYIKKWFAWSPAWAHIDDRPVIFVWNAAGCDIAERWMEASNNEWYVVLKLFPNFEDCAVQPDHWHQYGVGSGDPLNYKGYSTTIAPGFWRADISTPQLPRLSQEKFCSNVNSMVQSNEPWQLIVSFNEHGEATGVESTPNWASNTGYGIYLDCLHQYY